jgi:hypothetical protein
MKRHRPALFAAAAVLLALAGFASAPAQVVDREIPLERARALRLNVSGPIHLIPVAGANDVAFHVIDNGPSTPPIDVKVERDGTRLDVSITGPSENVLPFAGASGYGLEVRYPATIPVDLREFSGTVKVDRVSAPMQIYDMDGNIAVDDARSSLTAQADRGSITVSSAHARLMLTTIDGDVTAVLGAGFAGKLVRLESQNGNLSLAVPAGFTGHYDLTAAAGNVHNELRSHPRGALVFMLAEQGNVSVTAL